MAAASNIGSRFDHTAHTTLSRVEPDRAVAAGGQEHPHARDVFDGGRQGPLIPAANDPSIEQEVREKLAKLFQERFGNDPRRAFAHYDRDGDGKLSRSEIAQALEHAGVGAEGMVGSLQRWMISGGMVSRFDRDRDGALNYQEFLAAGR